MTAATAAQAPEAAPFSTEEMREAVSELDDRDFARAVATAAALERATNWILVHERAAGAKPIPALKTVGEALADPSDYYDGEACMEACRLACRGRDGIEAHLVASAIQYLWRSGRKGQALPDLLKAKDMIERLVRELGRGELQKPDPIASVRLADGSTVVAFQPHGLEVRAFTAEDLDERGMPRWLP